jgi:hypothetical protein
MAKGNTTPIAIAIIALGGGVWYYLSTQKDKTPVGLVVSNQVEGTQPLGENSDGEFLTTNAVEGTWRADEDSLSVASESAEKPLLVVYEDGTPIHAEVITMSEWVIDVANVPDECLDSDGNELENWTLITQDECEDAITEQIKDAAKKWRVFAKDAGATDESIETMFPTQESTQSQAAESIFGPMLSLQSHFVW